MLKRGRNATTVLLLDEGGCLRRRYRDGNGVNLRATADAKRLAMVPEVFVQHNRVGGEQRRYTDLAGLSRLLFDRRVGLGNLAIGLSGLAVLRQVHVLVDEVIDGKRIAVAVHEPDPAEARTLAKHVHGERAHDEG